MNFLKEDLEDKVFLYPEKKESMIDNIYSMFNKI